MVYKKIIKGLGEEREKEKKEGGREFKRKLLINIYVTFTLIPRN